MGIRHRNFQYRQIQYVGQHPSHGKNLISTFKFSHQADDDYVFQFATLLKANLDPSLHVYVEYSNEVWNSGFSQFGWNLNEAQQMVNNGTWGPVLNYDSINKKNYYLGVKKILDSNNIYDWAFRRVALRAKMISDTFRQVWGDCAINDRVRVVLASQVIKIFFLC